MAMHSIQGGEDDEGIERMAEMMGPGQVDQSFRQAMMFCCMSLPKDQRNVDELEKQVRRIFERALRNLREDSEQFRFGK